MSQGQLQLGNATCLIRGTEQNANRKISELSLKSPAQLSAALIYTVLWR